MPCEPSARTVRDPHSLPGLLAAVRELHRSLPRLPRSSANACFDLALSVLLADTHQRLGAASAGQLRTWAKQLAASSESGTTDEAEAASTASSAQVFSSLVNVVRGYARTVGTFCEAQATFLESLEERAGAQPGLERVRSSPLTDEVIAVESAYGEECSVQSDATGTATDISVRIWHEEGDLDRELRINARLEAGAITSIVAVGGKTTSDELILNAIFQAWQRLGCTGLWEAVETAAKTFCSGDTSPDMVLGGSLGSAQVLRRQCQNGLLLDAHVKDWFKWRPESASMQLAYFSLQQVGKHAASCVQKYFDAHKSLMMDGDPEIVISDKLAETFAAKLQDIRLSADGAQIKSPGLVFHASPSRDGIRSILSRGFLLPGDWIEGTPDFLEVEHGAGSGIGVYCSPVVETADRYCGEMMDSQYTRLVIVSLAAFGACWEPRNRFDETMEKSRRSWFGPPAIPQDGILNGWRRHGDFWAVAETDAKGIGPESEKSQRFKKDMPLSYKADVNGLYEGAYHSRRPQGGSVARDEIVLATTEQILPLLLVRYKPRQAVAEEAVATNHVSSNIYHYEGGGPQPAQTMCCAELSASEVGKRHLPEDRYWAMFVDWETGGGLGSGVGAAKGVDMRVPSIRVCCMLDTSVCSSDFREQALAVVRSLVAALQPSEVAAVLFDEAVDVESSTPFLPPERFLPRFEAKVPKPAGKSKANDNVHGQRCLGLMDALRFATDGALHKLARETEHYLAGIAEPWHRVCEGDELLIADGEDTEGSRRRSQVVVKRIERDVFRVTQLEIEWKTLGGGSKTRTADRIEAQTATSLTVVWTDGSTTRLLPSAIRRRDGARDVAAETQFLFVLISDLGWAATDTITTQTAFADMVGNCSSQLRGSGARCSWAPVVLGGDAAAQNLGTYLKTHLSTGTGAASSGGAAWWEPVYHCATPAEAPPLLERLQEELLSWAADGMRLGVEVSLNLGSASHAHGFVVDPLDGPSWQTRVRRPRPEFEASSLMRGTCLIFRGPLPRRAFVDGVMCGLEVVPELCPPARPSAPLELGFALERLAQKLRVATLGTCSTRGIARPEVQRRIRDWMDALRGWASRLQAYPLPVLPGSWISVAAPGGRPIHSQTMSTALIWKMNPAERADYLSRKRSLASGLLRTTNCIEDAVRLQLAAEGEPSAAAWLKRVSDMRFHRNMLKRAAKVAVPEEQALQQVLTQLQEVPAILKQRHAEMETYPVLPWLRSSASGLSDIEHAQHACDLDASLMRDMQIARTIVGMVGVQIRCIRTEASNVEPWMLVIDYVSSSFADTVSAACSLDLGMPLRDAEGIEAPDIAILLPQNSEQPCRWFSESMLYQYYLGIVFARNPVCTLPSQRIALPILVWVKSAEQLLFGRQAAGCGSETGQPKDGAASLAALCRVHLAAARTARCLIMESPGSWSRLAGRLCEERDLVASLTEAGDGPQSVCVVLAALCFSPAAKQLLAGSADKGLGTPSLQRLALALLAEAVSRGCRKLCRSSGGKGAETRLLWEALGVTQASVLQPLDDASIEPRERQRREAHDDSFDFKKAVGRSSQFFAPEGKYFQMGLTNCTPHGVVGTLLLHLAAHAEYQNHGWDAILSEDSLAAALAEKVWDRSISMKAFIEAVLPGTDPKFVQAALYAQGLRYHGARDRSAGVTPLSQPERILRELAQEQRHLAYLEAWQAKLQAGAAMARAELRSSRRMAVLSQFHETHRGFPRLFDHAKVSELNQHRPADDQLELLPTGLLKHHCCYPKCPLYLQNLQSQRDKQAELPQGKRGTATTSTRRNGLFKHLSPMLFPEADGEQRYLPLVHSIGAQLRTTQGSESFSRSLLSALDKQLAKRPAANALGDHSLRIGLQDVHKEFERLGKSRR